jgi:hypothetical protein
MKRDTRKRKAKAMAAFDHIERAAMRENVRASYVQKLRDIAAEIGLSIEHQATRRVRGWPQKSLKPWSLRYGDGTLLCAFAKLDHLERNLRGRAGC